MRVLVTSLAVVSLSFAALAADDPAAAVIAVVKLDKGDWAPVFDSKPTALMKQYFTAAFNKSWAAAMSHNKDEPVLDGDPITGEQSVTGVALKSTKVSGDAGRTLVTAELVVSHDGEAARREFVVFTMAREAGIYKIDDIMGVGMPSLRAYFRKNYGG